MQAPSITLTPAGNGVHVIDSAIAGTDPVARQKPLYADVFDDGSCLLVPLLSGRNPTALRHELADHPAVVTGRLLAREHCHALSAHVEPGPPLTESAGRSSITPSSASDRGSSAMDGSASRSGVRNRSSGGRSTRCRGPSP
jgi:hypothetical protein